MPIDRRNLEQILLGLGFSLEDRSHRFLVLLVDGRTVAKTMTSRGTSHSTINESMLSKIVQEMHITRAFLYQLVRGKKKREDYLDELRRQGLL